MPIEKILAPGENIRYRSPVPVDFQGDKYYLYITDRRLIWHKEEGLIFKRDKFVSVVLDEVREIKYTETGLIRKKGIIEVLMGDRKYEFSRPINTIIAIYNEMQALMRPKIRKT